MKVQLVVLLAVAAVASGSPCCTKLYNKLADKLGCQCCPQPICLPAPQPICCPQPAPICCPQPALQPIYLPQPAPICLPQPAPQPIYISAPAPAPICLPAAPAQSCLPSLGGSISIGLGALAPLLQGCGLSSGSYCC